MKHRAYRGVVRYTGDESGERGRERFAVTVHGSGERTIRAVCEMDDSEVLRDVTYTVDAAWRPVDAFVRLTVKDRFYGSGWFNFRDGYAECEAYTADLGRISQRVETSGRARSFGPHPVTCDIWHLGQVHDQREEGKVFALAEALMSSPLPNGASGPMLSREPLRARYHGQETITVPAGEFRCEHWSYLLKDAPEEHVWYLGDDLVIVRIRWDLLATTYELAEYDTTGLA